MTDNASLVSHVLHSMWLAAPLMTLLAAAVGVLAADVLAAPALRRRAMTILPPLGCAGALLALLAAGWPAAGNEPIFFGALSVSAPIAAAQAVILCAAAFVTLISPRYLEGRTIPQGEYYALVLLSTAGMLALAASTELLALFLNLELLSIPLYILAGLEKRNAASTEAAFKYFLLGSFAAAFLLLGIAFIFGATGQTQYGQIEQVIAGLTVKQPLFLAIGFGLVFVGMGFKLTLAPFHMYAPDVYEGAPAPVAALIATGSKVAGFCALFHVAALIPGMRAHLQPLWIALFALAALSMVVGNVGAVVQPRLKRMLAYSSIAHSAYTLVPVVVILRRPDLLGEAQSAMTFYLMAYTAMTLLAFGVVATLGRSGEGDVDDWRGLGRRAPWLAAAMTVALISLVGIPPTVGFFGKFQLFSLAVRGGHTALAIIGVVSSVASAFYYLRVIVTMYMSEPAGGEAPLPATGRTGAVALGLAALGVFALIFV